MVERSPLRYGRGSVRGLTNSHVRRLHARSHCRVRPDVRFSVVIPARNEERYIGRCLESIRIAAKPYPGQVEVIVVLNRCCDQTEEIAHAFGARTIREDARNLARIRNVGAGAATGSVLMTVDADSTVTPNMFSAIDHALTRGNTVGGGTWIVPERFSLGIVASLLMLLPFFLRNPISGGLFWCYLRDFQAIGGFDENFVAAEDVDFARRLKAYGKKVGRPFSTLRGAHIVTSCRKFDQFGDWCLVRNPGLVRRLVGGKCQKSADLIYYDVER